MVQHEVTAAELAELAEILEAEWPAIDARLHASGVPLNESTGDPEASSGDDDDTDGDDPAASGKDDDDAGGKDIDWKAMARKHERAAKKERTAREKAEAAVRDRESADQSEHEKAVAEARDEGERTAREAAQKEIRADRLENSVLKLAAKGLSVKDSEGTVHTVRFADPDDAFTYIERMVRRGDLDEDDVFDETGKVQTEALTEALTELLDAKPHLRATGDNGGSGSGGRRKVRGSADGGRGGGSGKALEDMSVEEHLERISKK